jgi:hypothetical protein
MSRSRAAVNARAGGGRYAGAMSLNPGLEEQQLLAESYRRAGARLSARELLGEALVGGGFFVAAAVLWWLQPPGSVAVLPLLVCVVVLALPPWPSSTSRSGSPSRLSLRSSRCCSPRR